MMSDRSIPSVALEPSRRFNFLVGRYVTAVLGSHGANGFFVS
jgi:hypothetical protein